MRLGGEETGHSETALVVPRTPPPPPPERWWLHTRVVEDVETVPKPPGDSSEQRNAEAVMVALLAEELGVPLAPRRVLVADGRWVEVDAAAGDLSVLCEAWAHQGPPKSAQRNKVMTDALKLVFVRDELGNNARLILLLSDEAAAAPFRGRSWYAAALEHFRVEVRVVSLPDATRAEVRAAQERQFR